MNQEPAMDAQPVIHDTFTLLRSYPAKPERVFSYFSDAARKRRWFGDGPSHDVEAFELDFRVGGVERSRYRMKPGTPIAGAILTNEGVFQEIAPDRRVVLATSMSMGEHRISSALVTVELFPDGEGTKLLCTHQAAFYEGADGPEMRKGGWVALIDRLGQVLAD
jgi:uncharacterized protein YndB with AHSA1/START domain